MSCFRSLSLEGIEKVFLVFRIQVVSKADLFNPAMSRFPHWWPGSFYGRDIDISHSLSTKTLQNNPYQNNLLFFSLRAKCHGLPGKRNILDGHQSSLYFTSNSPFSSFLITISANYFKSIPLKRIQNFNLFYKMRKFVLNFKYSSVSV